MITLVIEPGNWLIIDLLPGYIVNFSPDSLGQCVINNEDELTYNLKITTAQSIKVVNASVKTMHLEIQ